MYTHVHIKYICTRRQVSVLIYMQLDHFLPHSVYISTLKIEAARSSGMFLRINVLSHPTKLLAFMIRKINEDIW
jgi:hypothetical protein